MTEQYIRYAAMFIIIMMAVIDDYRRFKVSNRIIIAGMVIGVVINMGSLMYGGDVRGYIYGGCVRTADWCYIYCEVDMCGYGMRCINRCIRECWRN